MIKFFNNKDLKKQICKNCKIGGEIKTKSNMGKLFVF